MPTATPSSATISLTSLTLFLAIVITATMVGGEIDLTKFLPDSAGGTNSAARPSPQIVLIDGRVTNQGKAPALNLEITQPRYRFLGDLTPGETYLAPTEDFTIQYEWRDGEDIKRESKTFRIGSESKKQNGNKAAGQPGSAVERSKSIQASFQRTLYDMGLSANATAELMPEGLAASYDPAAHLLTVSAARPIEVRVDGFLLRPVSRADATGAEFRFASANLLVLGQDIKAGETTTFEVVFTKPQDFYSIPIYVREPGKPPVYFTVSVALKPGVQVGDQS